MRRGLLVFSRVITGLLIIVICAGVLALLSIAPARIEGGIAQINLGDSFGTSEQMVRISGHQLDCIQEPTVDRCTVEIQNRPLLLQVTYGNGKRQIFNETAMCEVTYGDRPVPCEVGFHFKTGDLPIVWIPDSLGLSAQTLEQLYRENFLLQLGRTPLLRWSTVIAILSGGVAAFNIAISERPFNRVAAAIVNGLAGLLGTITIQHPLNFWLGDWSVVAVVGFPVLIGTIVGFSHLQVARIICGLSLGLLLAGCLWWVSLGLLLILGYAA